MHVKITIFSSQTYNSYNVNPLLSNCNVNQKQFYAMHEVIRKYFIYDVIEKII